MVAHGRTTAFALVLGLLVHGGCGLDDSGGAPSNGASGGSSNGGAGVGGASIGGSGGAVTGGAAGDASSGAGGAAGIGGAAGFGGSSGSPGGGGAGGSAGDGGASGGAASGATGGMAGGGGTGGGASCGGACTDPNASCVSGACECAKGWVDTDSNPSSATCVATVTSVRVEVGIDHGRLGNLTIKLIAPSSKLITLMSRPGFTETADDGSANGTTWPPYNYGPSGDQSDLVASHPVTFADSAATSAEDMGKSQDGGGLAVCRDADTAVGGSPTPVCNYRPHPDAAKGPTALAAAFAGEIPTGKWRLCIGDSDPTTAGALVRWELSLETAAGALPPVSASGLALSIGDDGYSGTLASMTCHELTVS